MRPAWLLLPLLGLIALAGLSRPPARAHSAGMSTVLKAKKPARSRKPARLSRRDFVAEVKATAARVDAGKERLLSPAVRPLPRGAIKLADWELSLMAQGDTAGPGR